MKLKLFILLLFSVLCITSISAQKNNKKILITGIVLDAGKNPIVNAIIMIDGKNTSSVTDAKGNFKIKVKPDALKIGVFTFGLGIKEEEINGRTEINIDFGAEANQQPADETVAPGDQGVDVGYGYVKQKNLTTDVKKIDGSNKKYAAYSSISEMILRETSGVKYNGGEYIIQGSSNLQGSVPALLVLDGVYVNGFDNIAPGQVKSISVLKGADAAMYGTRGYGGVILIRTKVQNDQ
jgi:TonB-dependent SusC/RagA subfamily outer membrane receptor